MREQASELMKLRGYANHVRAVVERELAASGLSLGSDPSELGVQ